MDSIPLTGTKPQKQSSDCPVSPFRRIGYRDPETGQHYEFLTNNFALQIKGVGIKGVGVNPPVQRTLPIEENRPQGVSNDETQTLYPGCSGV